MIYRVVLDDTIDLHTSDINCMLLNPSLDLEMNSAGSFNFTLPPSHPYWDAIKVLKSTIDVYEDGDLIFTGRIASIEKNWNNERVVQCEGALAYFNDSIHRQMKWETPLPIASEDPTVHNFLKDILDNHNVFEGAENANRHIFIGNITVDPEVVTREVNYDTTLDILTRMCIDTNGGYMSIRKDLNDGKLYLDWIKDFTEESGQPAQFGLNLLNFDTSLAAEDICTGVLARGAEVNEQTVMLNNVELVDETTYPDMSVTHYTDKYQDILWHREGVEKFGQVVQVHDFSDAQTAWKDGQGQIVANSLFEMAKKWLEEKNTKIETIEVEVAELAWLGEGMPKYKLGQIVELSDNVHMADESYETRLLPMYKLSCDLNSGSKKVTLGTPPKKELTQISASNSDSSTLSSSGSSSGGGGGSGEGEECRVHDVKVDGTSVVTDKIANISLAGKADVNTVNALAVTVASKADTSTVNALATVVASKQNQIEFNTLEAATEILTRLKADNVVYNLGGGTEVEANPSETATDDLNTIKIGDTVYDIPGGGSTTNYGKFKCDELFVNTNGALPGTSFALFATLSDSITNYDALFIETSLYYNDNFHQAKPLIIFKQDFNFANSDELQFVQDFSAGSPDYRLFIKLYDETHIYAYRTTSSGGGGSAMTIAKVYGLKFENKLINRSDIYSEEERVIGRWTDGKPLYQKVLTIPNLPNATSANYPHGIQNVDNIWVSDGVAKNTQTGSSCQLNNTASNNVYQWVTNADRTNVSIWAGTDRRAFDYVKVILKYTKTTDAPNSGFLPEDPMFISDPMIYSEEEQVVGSWTDGKPLYQKTAILNGTYTGNMNSVDFGLGNKNIEALAFTQMIGWRSNDTFLPIPFYNPTSPNDGAGYVLNTDRSVTLRLGSITYSKLELTLRYTKTTDSILSGPKKGKIVQRSDIYYEEERLVGRWTDGKPLYQKTWSGLNVTPAYNSWTLLGITIPNSAELIDWKALYKPQSDNIVNLSGTGIEIRIYQNELQAEYNQNANVRPINVLTLQYTKTTDAPFSKQLIEDPQFVMMSDYYSEDEQVVGRWTDGKPIYQKSGSITYTANTPDWTVLDNNDIYDYLVSSHGTFYEINGTNQDKVSHYDALDASPRICVRKDHKLYHYYNSYSGNNRTFVYDYTIQYTKTTDAPGTGPTKGNLIYLPALYSEEEREVGVWTDGKPIYQKTWKLSSTIMINISGVTLPSQIGNDLAVAENIINASAVRLRSDNASVACIPLCVWGAGTSYSALCSDSWTAVREITIQYTKTTDQPGSGTWTPEGQLAHHYSTSEKIVGTWIDGSTVYERTWDFGSNVSISSGNYYTGFNINSSSMDKILSGNIMNNDGTLYDNASYDPTRDNHTLLGIKPDNNCNIRYLTLQYTKTS